MLDESSDGAKELAKQLHWTSRLGVNRSIFGVASQSGESVSGRDGLEDICLNQTRVRSVISDTALEKAAPILRADPWVTAQFVAPCA